MSNVTEEQWYKDPFGWYEKKQYPEIYGVQMTKTIALDFLAGLYDVYLAFQKKKYDHAVANIELLATLLIASAHNAGDEVINELLSREFSNMDFDAEIAKFIEGDNDGKTTI